MYTRIYNPLKESSFFVFGPRGTGKSTWLKYNFPNATFIDLLMSDHYRLLLANPSRLEGLIPYGSKIVIIDEVQRVPELLNEVHRLIEKNKTQFILTGSSARKLKREGVNLLAGRALQRFFHPLTCWELGDEFDLQKALRFGLLPMAVTSKNPNDFLSSYVSTYLREEIQAEGMVRNLASYSRFLEMASFSQAQPITMSRIASDVGVDSKLVASYFDLTEDLLLSYRLPVFNKKAKRRLTQHPKFYFFDVGVFQKVRPKGPLDLPEQIEGPALETLFFQHYRVLGEKLRWSQKAFYWRTASKVEVDFISYGDEGLFAFEFKRSSTIRSEDLLGLKEFKKDYPEARCYLVCFVDEEKYIDHIYIVPYLKALKEMDKLFGFDMNRNNLE